jgi:hypothetical protein
MTSKQNDKFEMANRYNEKSMKWQVDKMTNRRNVMAPFAALLCPEDKNAFFVSF